MSLPVRALSRFRVAVLGDGVAPRYCGRLFAAFGSEVRPLRRPGGGASSGRSDDGRLGYGGGAGELYGSWLDQFYGEPFEDSAGFEDCDLVVAGLDHATIAAGRAVRAGAPGGAAVLLAISWFDAAGPYADWRGSDELIYALSGLAYNFGPAEGPPTLPVGHGPQVLAGATAFTVGVAALLEPAESRPQRVDVNVLEATMCLSEVGAIAALADDTLRARRLGVNRFSPTYPCTSYRTSDGWVGVTCLTPSQWSAMCRLVGRPELASDEAYATSYSRLMRGDEVDAVLAPAIRQHTTAHWVEQGLRDRIPIAPMEPPARLPFNPHWQERGSFASLVPGSDEPALPTLPARFVFDELGEDRWLPDEEVAGPLSGVRVVDFTMGWAGPQATRLLADLGADVVKVESDAHPDWWRGWEAATESDPPLGETRVGFNALNRNKRGVALDLSQPQGLQAAKRLISRADVVVEAFAAGVIERIGLGGDVQAELRPGVISLSMPAFGSPGPLAGVRAYGSTVEQAAGIGFLNGDAAWPPCLSHVALGDPVAGVFAAAVIIAALAGRSQLGGCRIDLAQVACLFELYADAFAVGDDPPRTGNRRARLAPCCVVPALGEDAWLAVAVDSEPAWQALCSALGEPERASDPRLSSPAGRNEHAAELEEWLATWAASRPADEAAAALQEAGIPAAPVRPTHALGRDPHLASSGYWIQLERRYVGRHWQAAPGWRFDGERPVPRRPAPVLGEHTEDVLEQLQASEAAR